MYASLSEHSKTRQGVVPPTAYLFQTTSWYGNEMITEGKQRTAAHQAPFTRPPFATASLVLGIVLALILCFFGTRAVADHASFSAAETSGVSAATLAPGSASATAAPQGAQLIAGSALHAELLSGPQTSCAQPCVIPSPAPAPDHATLLVLCALALLVTLTLLIPPTLRRMRSGARAGGTRATALVLHRTHRTPSPPGIHSLSVCRT